MAETIGKVLGIALRSSKNGPMSEVSEAVGVVNSGLDGDLKPSPNRGITFLSSEQWETVTSELGKSIPWHTRRANVLVETPGLGALIGKTVLVGDLRIEIKGETRPCELMDELEPGLMNVLKPDCRAGVHGKILNGGHLRVGDVMTVEGA